jgi:hypothetical protein
VTILPQTCKRLFGPSYIDILGAVRLFKRKELHFPSAQMRTQNEAGAPNTYSGPVSYKGNQKHLISGFFVFLTYFF